MTTAKNKTISITPKADEKKTLSAQQKQFNTLTKKIDSQKQRLVEWQETIPVYQQKINQSYEPLQETFNTYSAEFLQLLDQHYDLPLFKNCLLYTSPSPRD